jgi:hypothetical protein
LFRKRCDENDRDAASLRNEAILKIKAVHSRHLHVGYQAGAIINPWRAQEILGGFEREGDEAERPYEARQCGAN